jgi:hypothetical protein
MKSFTESPDGARSPQSKKNLSSSPMWKDLVHELQPLRAV